MRSAKLVLVCHCLLFYLWLVVICLVHIFPRSSIIFTFGKILPTFVWSWETLWHQHGVGRNEEEGVFRYWVARSLGLFLCILECINVLRDALHVQMAVLQLFCSASTSSAWRPPERVRKWARNSYGDTAVKNVTGSHNLRTPVCSRNARINWRVLCLAATNGR